MSRCARPNLLLFGRVLRARGPRRASRPTARCRSRARMGRRRQPRRCARDAASLLVHATTTSRGSIAAFDAVLPRAHRPPAPGLPLFSLGERPRVVARPAPGVPVHVELEDIHAGTARRRPARSARGAPPACRAPRISPTSPTAELERGADAADAACPGASACGARDAGSGRRAAPSISGRCCGSSVHARRAHRSSPAHAAAKLPRPIVVLGDVSGSMERYSRMLLHFVYGLARSAPARRGFVFATRLTRITRHLDWPRGTSALATVLRATSRTGAAARASARRCARSTRAGRAASCATGRSC